MAENKDNGAWSAKAPSYHERWLFGLFAACWGSHQPLFAGGAGQFLEHIRAEVFPDERILVEQSKAANLSPLRRFGVQAYRPGRRLEQLEELAKRGLCFGGCHGDVTPIVHPPGGFFKLGAHGQ